MIRTGIFFLFLIVLSSCEHSPLKPPILFTQNIMTMDYHIQVGHTLTDRQKLEIEGVIRKVFEEIDTVYNKWNPKSELSLVNRLEAGKELRISTELYNFLVQVDSLVKLTEGRFDPTIEPLQRLWKDHLEKGGIPSYAEIELIKPAIGWDKIHLRDGLFYKDDDRLALDLGGVAKGYAVDLLLKNIKKMGFENVYVEWGGEIAAAGQHPAGRPWTIYISHFEDCDPEKAIAKVELKNQAIATSGNYLQNWEVSTGEKYTHIFDPKGLRPLEVAENSVASASVVAGDCATADAIATALMLFDSVEEAEAWAEKVPGVKVIIKSRGRHQRDPKPF